MQEYLPIEKSNIFIPPNSNMGLNDGFPLTLYGLEDSESQSCGCSSNWVDFEYNQETGDITFNRGCGNDNSEVYFFNPSNPESNYINGEGMEVGPIGFSGNWITIQLLTPGELGVKWRRKLKNSPFSIVSGFTSKILTVTRLSQRNFNLKYYAGEVLENADDSFFPCKPININGVELAVVNNRDEYIAVMNNDAANALVFTIQSFLLLQPVSPYQSWGTLTDYLLVTK